MHLSNPNRIVFVPLAVNETLAFFFYLHMQFKGMFESEFSMNLLKIKDKNPSVVWTHLSKYICFHWCQFVSAKRTQ